MKKIPFSTAFILSFCLWFCTEKQVQTELTSENLAGYLDTHSGILFTTAADKPDVLTKLQAVPYENELYSMPIMEYEGKTVLYIFQLSEVDNPSEFLNYNPSDVCMDEAFWNFDQQIDKLIDQAPPNLKGQILLACGRLAEDLEEEMERVTPKDRRKEEREKLEDFERKLLENGQEKGEAAENALKEGDPEAAKGEGEELKEKVKDDYYLDLDFCRGKKWDFGLHVRLKFEINEELPPELINEFERDFIRYKVYKEASCLDGPITIARTCMEDMPIHFGVDTLNRPIPIPTKWISEEFFTRKVCRVGAGFCVEQEVVIGTGKVYSDANCSRLINIRQYKGFSCFDS